MTLYFTKGILAVSLLSISCASAIGQAVVNNKYGQPDKFRQLDEIWPTPNSFRTAAGQPGEEYWQQRADYVIDVTLDDEKQCLTASQQITYHNNSPQSLRYLWLHLDANIFEPDSEANKLRASVPHGRLSIDAIKRMQLRQLFDGGFNITRVCDSSGNDLSHVIVQTVMRVDLPLPLGPGESFRLSIDWNYQINDSSVASMRTGAEFFEKDGNYIYEIAQWFPRMVAFSDAKGWQHRHYLGQGEFTLELGDYMVRITAPEDHIVAATGVLQNAKDVLTPTQLSRLTEAKTSVRPTFIVTPDEAKTSEGQKKSGTKTWVFHAQNVRDFAWASSRKFIWDAQGHDVEGNQVMAMSFYPNEAEPLWSQYSTHSIIHTLNVYSRYTFAYPYPVAISVNGPVGGMEYPMICFNGPRPQEDGTYPAFTKYGLISVVIHEVGHNYFPMIVNSDEREWTWMDEGLNTFLQYLAEQEWEENYPSQRGEPADIAEYMQGQMQVPIMTDSESLLQFGNNAYAKPATALNILRETILGRELFDFAFKEYARRWKFKRPMPADFFRTIEDASGVDLDWFWHGWFYTTDHCDIAIDSIQWLVPTDGDPDKEAQRRITERDAKTPSLSEQRNKDLPKRVDQFPELKDFYNSYDRDAVKPEAREAHKKMLESLTPEERELLDHKANYYQINFKNLGGLVMPVILKVTYDDGSEEIKRWPPEIWARNNQDAHTAIVSEHPITSIELDPLRETADANRDNNYFPPRLEPTRFQIYKDEQGGRRRFSGQNPMSEARQREEAEAKAREEEAKAREEARAKAEAEAKAKQEETSAQAEAEATPPAEADEQEIPSPEENQDAEANEPVQAGSN